MARIEKVGAELIPEALKLRLELLSIVLDRDESGRPLYKSLGFGENYENMGVTL